MDGAASLSIRNNEKLLVFRHGVLVLIITVLEHNDWTARIFGTDADGSKQFEDRLVRGQTFSIGYASRMIFDGISPNDQRAGRFYFLGPPHVDFWRQVRCPGNRYPGPHPKAKDK